MTLACGCPERYPDWHGQDVNLGGHYVHALEVPMFMHMPVAHGMYAQRQQEDVTRMALVEPWPGFTLIQTAALRGRSLRLVEPNDSPARTIQILPTPFHLRVRLHEGDVGTIRQPVHDMQLGLLDDARKPLEFYLAHLTCPQCQEARGGDRVMLLRRWEPSAGLERRVKGGAAGRK